MLPPIVLTVLILLVPIFVLAEGRPNSNFLFFRTIGRFPPVFLLLWTLSREIPMAQISLFKVVL